MQEKRYLSSQDIFDIIKLNTFVAYLRQFLGHWDKYLTKQEIKDIKMATTITQKTWDSIIDRTSPADCEKIYKKNEMMDIVMLDKFQRKQIDDRIGKCLDKLWREDNYYRLCELVMDMNCVNCTKQDKTCGIYKEFCENLVPEPSEEDYKGKRCKYGYESKGK